MQSKLSTFGVQTMAKVRVMYWKEIPAQIQAEDESDQVSCPLSNRFQQGIDAISMFDGSVGSDEYLESWEWGEYFDVPGDSDFAAKKVAQLYNNKFPTDFIKRIRTLHKSGKRIPVAGTADIWMGKDEKQ